MVFDELAYVVHDVVVRDENSVFRSNVRGNDVRRCPPPRALRAELLRLREMRALRREKWLVDDYCYYEVVVL